MRFIWNSNYSGIAFPPTKTVVLRVEGPTAPNYWRTTTLDLVSDNHWSEDLFWLDQVDGEERALQLPQLVPARAAKPTNWLEQTVQVEALVDDHLAAAGTPVGLDASRLGIVFQLSGGVLRARDPVRAGQRYRVWSYAPDPSPRALAVAPARRPPAITRFLEVDGRVFPRFRDASARACDACVLARSVVRRLRLAPHAVRGRAPGGRKGDDTVRSRAGPRVVVPANGRVPLRRVAAPDVRPAARGVRDADESGVLSALRWRDGAHAPIARDPGARRRGVHERKA